MEGAWGTGLSWSFAALRAQFVPCQAALLTRVFRLAVPSLELLYLTRASLSLLCQGPRGSHSVTLPRPPPLAVLFQWERRHPCSPALLIFCFCFTFPFARNAFFGEEGSARSWKPWWSNSCVPSQRPLGTGPGYPLTSWSLPGCSCLFPVTLFLSHGKTHLEWVTFNGVRKIHTVREKSQVRANCFLPRGRVIFSPPAPTMKIHTKELFCMLDVLLFKKQTFCVFSFGVRTSWLTQWEFDSGLGCVQMLKSACLEVRAGSLPPTPPAVAAAASTGHAWIGDCLGDSWCILDFS